jgi:hypothetical protein
VDGLSSSEKALDYAIRLAKAYGAEMHISFMRSGI